MSLDDAERYYEELLRAAWLDEDPYSRLNLEAYRPRHLTLLRAIERYLPSERRHVVADIGCQAGAFLKLCERLGFRRLLAVDYFEVSPARSFVSGLSNARFIKANFNERGFLRELPDASVDCLVSTEVFEHLFHHPLGYLQECWRVLSSGGLLLFSTPNPCTLANALRLAAGRPIGWGGEAFARTPKLTSEGEAIAVWDIHFREYSADEMRSIFGDLPDLGILESGFLANAAASSEPLAKRTAKKVLWKAGLGHWRPLCATQYMVLSKLA